MGKPRKFTPEFKAKVALAALKGEKPLAVLCRNLSTDFKSVPYVLPPDGPAGSGVTVGESETKELGDVTVPGFE